MDQPPRKYQPLAHYLAALNRNEVTLTFTPLERIVGAPLARFAGTRQFWVNNLRRPGHPSYAWLTVGWRVAAADVRRDQITFRRDGPHMCETTAGVPPR